MSATTKQLLDQAAELISACNFDRSDNSQVKIYNEAITLLEQAADLDAVSDRALLRLCIANIRFHKKHTIDVLRYSREALRRRETYDSVVYFAKSCIYNLDAKDAILNLEDAKRSIKDSDLSYLLSVFIGIVHYNSGNYDVFCESIEQFRKNKSIDFNPYITIPLSTVRTGPSYLSRDLNIGQLSPQLIHFSQINAECIISVSCDDKYLERYGDLFFDGFIRSQSATTICHLALATAETAAPMRFLRNSKFWPELKDRIIVSAWEIKKTDNIGPIAASLRMMHITQLLRQFNVPVVSMDFDSVLLRPIQEIFPEYPECDALFRMLKNVAPWEMITGGFTAIMPSDAGKIFADHLNGFLSSNLTLDGSQWWIDQNALESAFRAMKEDSHPFQFHDIFATRDNFVIQPTGKDELKLNTLARALNKS